MSAPYRPTPSMYSDYPPVRAPQHSHSWADSTASIALPPLHHQETPSEPIDTPMPDCPWLNEWTQQVQQAQTDLLPNVLAPPNGSRQYIPPYLNQYEVYARQSPSTLFSRPPSFSNNNNNNNNNNNPFPPASAHSFPHVNHFGAAPYQMHNQSTGPPESQSGPSTNGDHYQPNSAAQNYPAYQPSHTTRRPYLPQVHHPVTFPSDSAFEARPPGQFLARRQPSGNSRPSNERNHAFMWTSPTRYPQAHPPVPSPPPAQPPLGTLTNRNGTNDPPSTTSTTRSYRHQRVSSRSRFDAHHELSPSALDEPDSDLTVRTRRPRPHFMGMQGSGSPVVTQTQMKKLREELKHLLPSELPDGTSHMCDICQKDYSHTHVKPTDEEEIAIQLPCKHVFGEHCINTWFETCQTQKHKITCPMCRKVLAAPPERGSMGYLRGSAALLMQLSRARHRSQQQGRSERGANEGREDELDRRELAMLHRELNLDPGDLELLLRNHRRSPPSYRGGPASEDLGTDEMLHYLAEAASGSWTPPRP
ncbi:hypothetical protein K432DRAFT_405293 [Lepidopterella palustris CBS 459.81]|uniref:Anaphase-promoting complex subunit 11 n=1 Tax=Lepidopterella palustris CBS 459.81 TaxID=1314670 RepID=A0A8E2JET7_9PEZI|nr:hypothetical protein K432DRAFT_405293 [Lepidopterella palustris CBS 459.81]